jgi:hypothetical protein
MFALNWIAWRPEFVLGFLSRQATVAANGVLMLLVWASLRFKAPEDGVQFSAS